MPDPEGMREFFDGKSTTYDDHMKRSVAAFKELYNLVADPIPPTQAPIEVLDIGCGTGLEFEAVFNKAPNARITGIDLSAGMLDECRAKYAAKAGRIRLIQESYLDYTFEPTRYDYVLSVMTVHHLLPERKLELYRRIRRSLKTGGCYIEADYIVSPDTAQHMLDRFLQLRKDNPDIEDGTHHIDIPLSLEGQEKVLKAAGFTDTTVLWSVKDAAILVCR